MTKRDFSKLFRSGKRVRGRTCSFQYGDLGGPDSKIAIVVQVKAAPHAVMRNRIRRVLSEHITPLIPRLTRTVFLVLIVHKKPDEDGFRECVNEMNDMLIKSGIIKP